MKPYVKYFTRLSLDRRRGCRGGYIFFFRDIKLKYTWLRNISWISVKYLLLASACEPNK